MFSVTPVFAIVASLLLKEVAPLTDPELMAISIGRISKGSAPYILEESLYHCFRPDVFKKHNNNATTLNIVRCAIVLDSIVKTETEANSTALDQLIYHCDNWVKPEYTQCFEETTFLINNCYEGEPTKGYNSLFFSAAYMNFLCNNTNQTAENLVQNPQSGVTFACYEQAEQAILGCVKNGTQKNPSTDLCRNYDVVKDCYKNNYARTCNSSETIDFMNSLLQSIEGGLCTKTKEAEMMETMKEIASRQTAPKRAGRNAGDHDSSSSSGSSTVGNSQSQLHTVYLISISISIFSTFIFLYLNNSQEST